MGVDQPECGAGRASPAKWSNTNTGKKKQAKMSIVGLWVAILVVLKMTCSQSGCEVQTHLSAPPVRATRGA
jgi:hypothetical protein